MTGTRPSGQPPLLASLWSLPPGIVGSQTLPGSRQWVSLKYISLRSEPSKGSAGAADGHGTDRELSPPAFEFEGSLTPGCEGVGGCVPPVAVGLGCSFESLDATLLGTDVAPRWIARSDGVEALPRTLEFGGVERGWVVEDFLLAGVEVGELLVVEVMEATGEVAVGLEAGVVPGGAGVGA
jgi:hypothetical protein